MAIDEDLNDLPDGGNSTDHFMDALQGKIDSANSPTALDGQDGLQALRVIEAIKEAGIENEVLRLVREKGVEEYFLLDVEFPYIYQSSRKGERSIAMRYSEDECIETVLKYADKIDWVWIDTNTQLPLNEEIVDKLKPFNTCLVCYSCIIIWWFW